MDRVAHLSAAQRQELFTETAARQGMTPAVVEKDFWVTWVLDRLFAVPALARLLMFKGGTSLSKAYGLIERFSEDIDLILDWRVLSGEDLLAERSRSQQTKLNDEINNLYQTARNDLLQLEALGLLEKSKQGNAFVFYAPANLSDRLNTLAQSRPCAAPKNSPPLSF